MVEHPGGGDPGLLGVGLRGVRAEVLLADGLEPLPLRGGGAEELAGERQGLVELLASARTDGEADPLPPLLLLRPLARRGLHLGGERPDGTGPGLRHPGRLGLAARDRDDGLGLARAHLAGVDGLAQERPLGEVPGQPGQLLGGAAGDPEPLARVVPEPREAQAEEPVADPERGQPLAEREVDGAAPPRHADQQSVQQERRLVAQHRPALVGHDRLERAGHPRERLEVGVGRR